MPPFFSLPVVIRVGNVIARLHLLQEEAHLGLLQMELLRYACLLQQVVHQHGQTVAWSGFCEGKYVKVPVALCILHNHRTP